MSLGRRLTDSGFLVKKSGIQSFSTTSRGPHMSRHSGSASVILTTPSIDAPSGAASIRSLRLQAQEPTTPTILDDPKSLNELTRKNSSRVDGLQSEQMRAIERDLDCTTTEAGEVPTMTSHEYYKCVAVFLLLGASALYYWNSVLNTMYSVVAVQYPQYPHLADTITSSYSSVSFVTAITLSIIGPLNKWLNVAGGIVLTLMTIIFPVVTLSMDGYNGAVMLHVTAVIAGIAETCFQVAGYAYAVILPRPCGSWVSFGYGICGVLTFCLWMLFSQGIFDINSGDRSQVKRAVWCHMVCATVMTAVAVVVFWFFAGSNVAKEAVKRAAQQKKAQADEEQAYACQEAGDDSQAKKKSQGFRLKASQYWNVFAHTWLMQVGMALSMGMSMMAYPLIGPYRWNRSIKENDVLTGIFQVCDFTGRYIPNLSWLIPWLMIPGWLVVPLTLCRGVLLGLFIWIAKSTERGEHGLLQEYGVQVVLMIAMALTHGWYASVYMARIPEGVSHPKDKARAGAMGVSLLIFMIAAGLWLAKAV